MKVALTVHGNERDGEKFEFTEPGSLLFGRSEKAQCRIVNDPYVSRAHFLLLINPPDVRLRNLSRTNGTEVDGVLYNQSGPAAPASEVQTLVKGEEAEADSEAILRNGSQIEVGYTRIGVAVEADAAVEPDVFCTACGTRIPGAEKEAATKGRISLCRACRKKKADGAKPPPKPGTRGRIEEIILRRLGLPHGRGRLPAIPGYEIVRPVGTGGMGLVLESTRVSDGFKVAIKIIKPDRPVSAEFRSRFKREIRLTRELRHPHIIEFIEDGDANGLLWLAMEYVEGGYDIAKHMRKHGGRVPIREAVTLVCQALDAIDFAYRDKGVVHRDLKPPNIFLVAEGAGYAAKVADLGLAKSLENSGLNGSIMTKPGACMGTIPYMPPEQAVDIRSATPAADVFAMGATLYHMLTGRLTRDYAPRQNEAIRQVVQDPVIPVRKRNPSIPAPLALVVDKSLSLDPNARYRDAGEFKTALQATVR